MRGCRPPTFASLCTARRGRSPSGGSCGPHTSAAFPHCLACSLMRSKVCRMARSFPVQATYVADAWDSRWAATPAAARPPPPRFMHSNLGAHAFRALSLPYCCFLVLRACLFGVALRLGKCCPVLAPFIQRRCPAACCRLPVQPTAPSTVVACHPA